MNIQVDPTSSNLASSMLNSKIRTHAVVGYGVKIFRPSPLNYVTRSPGNLFAVALHDKLMFHLCKHIIVHAHLLFLFSLCFSNHNNAIPDCNNKNEAEQTLDTVIP